jgi:hypothetical protein
MVASSSSASPKDNCNCGPGWTGMSPNAVGCMSATVRMGSGDVGLGTMSSATHPGVQWGNGGNCRKDRVHKRTEILALAVESVTNHRVTC